MRLENSGRTTKQLSLWPTQSNTLLPQAETKCPAPMSTLSPSFRSCRDPDTTQWFPYSPSGYWQRGQNQCPGLWAIIQDQGLVHSSCTSPLLTVHQELHTLDCFWDGKSIPLSMSCFSSQSWQNAIPTSSHSLFAPGFPNTHTTFFVSGQERSRFLNFSFYYVNICEQINCECGFHAVPCLGPHISFPTHWDPMHLADESMLSGWL